MAKEENLKLSLSKLSLLFVMGGDKSRLSSKEYIPLEKYMVVSQPRVEVSYFLFSGNLCDSLNILKEKGCGGDVR